MTAMVRTGSLALCTVRWRGESSLVRRLRCDGYGEDWLPGPVHGEMEGRGPALQELVDVPAPVHRLPVNLCHNISRPMKDGFRKL